ncbi:hypothetical protein IWW36_005062 [Coemansia brasiliensis]|uniref:Uncharacterized protein n=1 Tax=Coemansia brasiliensis TaxID=2650707 RepID=A0A9W8I4I0_9FUNG|nr:hypothetical protein IWW36_005062 [Coemansia brasiliensis]
MQFKRSFAVLALSAIASTNAAVINLRQGANLDVEGILNSMESMYNDPAYIEQFASQALAYASAVLPPGYNLSEKDLLSAMATMDDSIVPVMVSKAISSVDAIMEQLTFNPEVAVRASQAISMLHNTSVFSRLNDMVEKLLHNIASEYQDGDVGKPTGATDEDGDSQEENTTSGAVGISSNMLLSIGAIAGAAVSFF